MPGEIIGEKPRLVFAAAGLLLMAARVCPPFPAGWFDGAAGLLMANEAWFLGLFAAAVFAGCRVCGIRVAQACRPGICRASHILFGAAAGLLWCPVSVLVTMLWTFMLTRWGIEAAPPPVQGLWRSEAASRGVIIVIALVTAPVLEEIWWRGWLLDGLCPGGYPRGDGRRAAAAAAVTAAAFAAIHFSMTDFAALTGIGLLLSWCRRRTGGLWAGMALHFVNNLAGCLMLIVFGD